MARADMAFVVRVVVVGLRGVVYWVVDGQGIVNLVYMPIY